jgi:tRNA pseudouridine13 synthase
MNSNKTVSTQASECVPQVVAYVTSDLPGIGGTIKRFPKDFEVEEIPAYEPSGAGEHLFLWVEKCGLSAEQLVTHVAQRLDCPSRDIGTAGMKDRQAVTRQFVSVPLKYEARVERLDGDGVRVLDAKPNQNKLRTGHTRGNRFSILIRDVDAGALEPARSIGMRIEASGFPNSYGLQRFGSDGGTLRMGCDLLAGRVKKQSIPYARRRFLLRLALSAAQSELFNRALNSRLHDGLLWTVMEGDVMQRLPSGGPFVARDVPREQERFDAGETVITGPMFGPKMTHPEAEPALREQRVLEASGLSPDQFTKFPKLTAGTRRGYLVRLQSLTVEPETDGIRLAFALPSGSYATSLVREFQKNDGA